MRRLILFAAMIAIAGSSSASTRRPQVNMQGNELVALRALALNKQYTNDTLRRVWPNDWLTRPRARFAFAIKVQTWPGLVQFGIYHQQGKKIDREIFSVKAENLPSDDPINPTTIPTAATSICSFSSQTAWITTLQNRIARLGDASQIEESYKAALENYQNAAFKAKTEIESMPFYEARRFDYREFPMDVQRDIVSAVRLYWYFKQWQSVCFTATSLGQLTNKP